MNLRHEFKLSNINVKDEFIEGKNAPPKLVPVNPEAAQAKPKINVAKKANILDTLANRHYHKSFN